MRKYDANDERAIRMQMLIREWTRSGLLKQAQQEQVLPELKVTLRRTNPFLRLILFAFGFLIIVSALAFVGITAQIHDELATATLLIVAAAASYIVAELLISRYRLYRFGIEEAAAVVSVALAALGIGIYASRLNLGTTDFEIVLGWLAAAIIALTIYARLGYVYAAGISMLCAGIAPFASNLSPERQRLICEGFFIITLLVIVWKSRATHEEFRRDEYSIIRAMAWVGAYASFNLHLPILRSFRTGQIAGSFHEFTYAAIWILPATGIVLALRGRERFLLDVSILTGLVTLATNKSYLGQPQYSWDPILLGIVLIAVVIGVRRWLSHADRHGFTSERILSSDKRRLSVLGTASATLHTAPPMPVGTDSSRSFDAGGGKSGGAGASGTF